MGAEGSATSGSIYRLGWPYPIHLVVISHPDVILGGVFGGGLVVGGAAAIARGPAQSVGCFLLVLGVGGCAFTLVAVARLCLRAWIWPEGTLTLRWIVRQRSFDVLDVTALHWRRPKDMVRVHPSRLEPFVIEVGDARIRVEAVGWVMRELAEAIRSHNPSVELDLPQFS